MARFRRSSAMHPVKRIKHVVDFSATITAGTQLNTIIILAKDAPVLANTTECETGSTVHGIYARVEVAPNETDAGAIPNVYMAVIKNPAGLISPPDIAAVGSSNVKKYVIHQEMTMVNNLAGGNPRTIFNGVIKFPKGYKRNGPDDRWFLSLKSTAVNMAICAQVHYKEFQ